MQVEIEIYDNHYERPGLITMPYTCKKRLPYMLGKKYELLRQNSCFYHSRVKDKGLGNAH